MILLLKLCSIVFALNLLLSRVGHCQLLFSSNVDPDFSRTPCELIESRKFICEEHFVTTDDGYILALHHIINPVYKRLGKKLIKPMVLQHGLLGSSTHFLTNSNGGFAADWTNETVSVDLTVEGRNLAFLLANLGYDVWMPNSRGNKYSKNHTTLDPNQDSSFWQISFDEMISYDCPAVIDYILSKTGFDHLGWIGHSQGSLIMFGMLAERPEYTDKVKPFVALAPIAHVEHIKSPIRYITLIPGAMRLVKTLGGELSLPSFLLDILSEKVCGRRIVRQVCGSALFLLCGYDPDQFNYTRTPVYYSHAMGGTSAWNLLHFGQNILNRNFLKFDYGFFGNIFRYGSLYPPAYNLEAIQSENIVLIRSNNDPFADSQDVQILKASLKHPHIDFLVQDQKFNHLDFIWAKNVYEQVYGPMLGILERFN